MSLFSEKRPEINLKKMCIAYYRLTGVPLVLAPKLAQLAQEQGAPAEAVIENKPLPTTPIKMYK